MVKSELLDVHQETLYQWDKKGLYVSKMNGLRKYKKLSKKE